MLNGRDRMQRIQKKWIIIEILCKEYKKMIIIRNIMQRIQKHWLSIEISCKEYVYGPELSIWADLFLVNKYVDTCNMSSKTKLK